MRFPFWPDFTGYRNIELGLSRVYQLLERLGNPQKKLPPTIHLAGTNGKGSTLSFLRSIFVEAGYNVHCYTSPHLVNFNERIVLNNAEISDDFLSEILQHCQKAAQKSPAIPVTFFEGITVAAIVAFSRIKSDILLLETGMGGRLDATNILPQVLCSIITPIAFDHTDFLGKTLSKIAFEKAGIIKKDCPVIVGKQKISALKSIETQAAKLNAATKIFARDWKVKKDKNGFLFCGFDKNLTLPMPSLIGDHQIENAGAAIAATLTQQQFKISEENIRSAISKTFWPCRLQKIMSGKFLENLPKNFDLYVDGSHNLQGATTLEKFLKQQKNKKIFVIFSMLQDKDCFGFLKKIAPQIDQLFAMAIPDEAKSRPAKEIALISENLGVKTLAIENFDAAFSQIKCSEPALILICGSLYLAGSFLNESSAA